MGTASTNLSFNSFFSIVCLSSLQSLAVLPLPSRKLLVPQKNVKRPLQKPSGRVYSDFIPISLTHTSTLQFTVPVNTFISTTTKKKSKRKQICLQPIPPVPPRPPLKTVPPMLLPRTAHLPSTPMLRSLKVPTTSRLPTRLPPRTPRSTLPPSMSVSWIPPSLRPCSSSCSPPSVKSPLSVSAAMPSPVVPWAMLMSTTTTPLMENEPWKI